MLVISGIAGCGKTTLTSHWLNEITLTTPDYGVMYYPCHPWDTPLGIATSLLHKIGVGVDEGKHDPYNILEALPLRPGVEIDIDSYRRRLSAHLLDESGLTTKAESQLLVVLDDVHNIGSDGNLSLIHISEPTRPL